MTRETEEANALFTKALHNAVAWQNRCVDLWEIIEMFCLDAEAEKQEPVAYLNPDDLCADTAFRWCKIDAFTKPVYLHSPQRTWVGLTDEQKEALSQDAEGNPWAAVELAEAKLKELNT